MPRQSDSRTKWSGCSTPSPTQSSTPDGRNAGATIRQPLIVSQIAHEHAIWLAHHTAAIAAANLRQRSAVAAIHSVRFVTNLSDAVVKALGVATLVRMVRIAPAGLKHITDRRAKASQADVDLSVGKLSECFDHLEAWILPQRDKRVFELLAFSPSQRRRVILPLKFVSAATSKSGEDEWWVRTSHPAGADTLRRNHKLRPLPR